MLATRKHLPERSREWDCMRQKQSLKGDGLGTREVAVDPT